jgi:outer membrane protein assembly factor BamB
MTPDEVDALLQRIPPPSPTPQLRDRVLADLAQRMNPEHRIAQVRRRALRRSVWGGLALAMAIGGFTAILWIVLPKPPGSAPDAATSGEDRGRRDEDPAFTRKVWEGPLSHREITRLTPLDRLYVEGADGTLTALDRRTGQSAWIFQSDRATPLDWPPVISEGVVTDRDALQLELRALDKKIEDQLAATGPGPETQALQKRRNGARERLRVCELGDNLYFSSRQVLYCLDRASGALKWTQRLTFVPSGPPFAIRCFLFVPDAAGARVHVLDVEKKGADVLTYQVSAGVGGNPVLGGPVYADPSLYLVAPDAALHCFRVTDGAIVWTFSPEPGKPGEPLVHTLRTQRLDAGGALAKVTIRMVLFSAGQVLYALDAGAGTLVWKFDCGAPLSGRPIVFGESVYVLTEKGVLLSLEVLPEQNLKMHSGSVRWKVDGCSQLLTNGRKGLYVLGSKREILAVKESSGEILGRYPTPSTFRFFASRTDGLLYMLRPTGTIVCFEEAD